MHRHPIDLPELSYAKPKFRHYLEHGLFRSFSFILSALPKSVSFKLAHSLADFARFVLKKKSEQTLQSICEKIQCDEKEGKEILKKSFRNFAENWVHLSRNFKRAEGLPKLSKPVLEEINKAKQEGRGIVFALGHLGWWENIPQSLYHKNHQVAVTVAVQHNPVFDRYINHQRTCGGFHSILHNRLGIRHTFNYLKAGGHLAILADIDVREKGIPVPFMGQLASTPKWPAEIARRTDSLLYVARHKVCPDGSQEILLSDKIDPRDFEKSEDPIYEMSLKMNHEFGKYIYDTPEQWFWLQRRWKTSYPKT